MAQQRSQLSNSDPVGRRGAWHRYTWWHSRREEGRVATTHSRRSHKRSSHTWVEKAKHADNHMQARCRRVRLSKTFAPHPRVWQSRSAIARPARQLKAEQLSPVTTSALVNLSDSERHATAREHTQPAQRRESMFTRLVQQHAADWCPGKFKPLWWAARKNRRKRAPAAIAWSTCVCPTLRGRLDDIESDKRTGNRQLDETGSERLGASCTRGPGVGLRGCDQQSVCLFCFIFITQI